MAWLLTAYGLTFQRSVSPPQASLIRLFGGAVHKRRLVVELLIDSGDLACPTPNGTMLLARPTLLFSLLLLATS